MEKIIRIIFGGDLCGIPGLRTLRKSVPVLTDTYKPDFFIVNGENVSDGAGVTASEAHEIFSMGIDLISGGNHSLEKFETRAAFGADARILRPHNYPLARGTGLARIQKNGVPFALLNVQGREFMRPIDCPFQTADRVLSHDIHAADIVLVDFHAESTAEKEALAFYLDGRVSALVGTHTHTQTADDRILPGGTAYITDAGMIGVLDSVVGGDPTISMSNSVTQIPQKYEIAENGAHFFCGVYIEIEQKTSQAVHIERIRLPVNSNNNT